MTRGALTRVEWLWQKPLEETEGRTGGEELGTPMCRQTPSRGLAISRNRAKALTMKDYGRSLSHHPQERSVFPTPLTLDLDT